MRSHEESWKTPAMSACRFEYAFYLPVFGVGIFLLSLAIGHLPVTETARSLLGCLLMTFVALLGYAAGYFDHKAEAEDASHPSQGTHHVR